MEELQTRVATNSSDQSRHEGLDHPEFSQTEMKTIKCMKFNTKMDSTSSNMKNLSTHSKIGTRRVSDNCMISVVVKLELVAIEVKSMTSYRISIERRINSIRSFKT